MNKKILIISIVTAIVFIIGSIITLVLANNGSNENINIEKLDSQILYLDGNIINIANTLNNITLNDNSSILNRDTNINWNSAELEISKVYSNWNNIIIELNSANIPNDSLISFGKRLDNVAIAIKNKDKIATLSKLSDLYYLLIIYTNSYSKSQELINNITTKYYLLKAYSLIDTNNWTLINENIIKAEQAYYNNINLIEDSNNQLNKNKTYVSIKELENISITKEKDLFYLKYKLVLENIKTEEV